jgi:hypothetical protein
MLPALVMADGGSPPIHSFFVEEVPNADNIRRSKAPLHMKEHRIVQLEVYGVESVNKVIELP